MLLAMTETWKFQLPTSWNGKRQFELLNTKKYVKDNSEKTELYDKANGFVLDLLANTSTMKLSHVPPGALDSFLADIWDHKDNRNKSLAHLLHSFVMAGFIFSRHTCYIQRQCLCLGKRHLKFPFCSHTQNKNMSLVNGDRINNRKAYREALSVSWRLIHNVHRAYFLNSMI